MTQEQLEAEVGALRREQAELRRVVKGVADMIDRLTALLEHRLDDGEGWKR
jgi:hypothetical protein